MATSPLLGQRSDALELTPHPDALTEGGLAAWAKEQAKSGRPIAIDLFSGAGGLSAGIEAAGWAVAAAVDLDRRALETHRHNFPGLGLQLDLGDESVRDEFIALFDGVDGRPRRGWPAVPTVQPRRPEQDPQSGRCGRARRRRPAQGVVAGLPRRCDQAQAARDPHGERPRHGAGR